MRALFLGAFLAAVVLFVWGFLIWAIMPINPFGTVADAPALAAALLDALPATGTYLLPPSGDPSTYEATLAAYQQGPVATIFFHREGLNPQSAGGMGLGFVHMLATALLLALVLRTVVAALPVYGQRVAFVAFLGVTAAVWANLGDPIWWHHPWDFHLLNFFYEVGAWLLAGLVLARFVRPHPATD